MGATLILGRIAVGTIVVLAAFLALSFSLPPLPSYGFLPLYAF